MRPSHHQETSQQPSFESEFPALGGGSPSKYSLGEENLIWEEIFISLFDRK